MPLYHYKCPHCKATKRKILEPKEAEVACIICVCGDFMERDVKPPTTKTTEVLDNGAMVRKVERPSNAEELFRERAHGKKGVV